MPRTAPVTFASAGAMTTLKRMGVSSGTTTSRGVRALRAKRRPVNVLNGVSSEGFGGCAGARVAVGGVVVIAVMGFSWKRSGGEAVAAQMEVHVVESRPAGAHRVCGYAELGDRRHCMSRRAPVQRDGQRGPDAEGVLSRDPLGAQGLEGGRRVAVDPKLEEL